MGIIDHLFDQFNPELEPEIHAVASQTLIDIITLTYQVPQTEPGMTPSDVAGKSLLGSGNNLLITEMKTYLAHSAD